MLCRIDLMTFDKSNKLNSTFFTSFSCLATKLTSQLVQHADKFISPDER